MATFFTVLVLIFTYVIAAATEHEKPKDEPVVDDTEEEGPRALPFCGIQNPENPREELMLARTNLKELSSPDTYKDVNKKISDLLTKESKDWNKGNLLEALQSFSNGLQERVQSEQKVQKGDFNGAIRVLGNLCCVLKHTGARCNIGDIERRLMRLSKGPDPKTLKSKLQYLAALIKSEVDDGV